MVKFGITVISFIAFYPFSLIIVLTIEKGEKNEYSAGLSFVF
jgi:hypothetical protein